MKDIVHLRNSYLDIEVDPMRGNIIGKCTAFGKDWMYIDQENYESKERPRCGSPVLFPYMGSLPKDELRLNQSVFPTLIHGVVHTNSWTVLHQNETVASFETKSDASSFLYFPFTFVLKSTISIVENTLHYEMMITNTSPCVMPCDCGFHPFFKIQKLRDVKLKIKNQEMQWEDDFYQEVTTKGKFLKDTSQITCISEEHQFTLKALENLPHLFLWSGKPDQFLVLEPWTSPFNAMNEGTQRFNIEPNGYRKVAWQISFES